MNERLVCIKVDREERPDVDQIYMDALVCLTGEGGWPLNVFCTPEGRPFWGGTYFPPRRMGGRPGWPEAVEAVSDLFQREPEKLEEQAGGLLAALRARPGLEPAKAPGLETLTHLCEQLMRRADPTHGGFGGAPKFPTPPNLEAMLLAADRGAETAGAREHVLLTCERMARGGIFDQLGGGFHRYSTDAGWRVPHFEKMLYDQGQLLRVYAEAYRQTGNEDFRWPVEETIEWLEREMRSPEGGFCASQDADSEGEEGRFYLWNRAQIQAVLGPEEGAELCNRFGVSEAGDPQHGGESVLREVAAGPRERHAPQRRKLFQARRGRVPPETDSKHVTSWIAYTLGGMATAGAAFGRDDWVEGASRAADFVLERLHDERGQLLRIWDGRQARIPAFLDDHAAWLGALLDLHRAGGDDRFIEAAIAAGERIRSEFFDAAARKLYLAAAGDDSLVFRPESDSDGATPAAAGLAVLGLVRLSALCERADLRAVAEAVLEAQGGYARQLPTSQPTSIRAGALLASGLGVGLVIGARDDDRTRALAQRARTLLGSEDAVVVVPPDSKPSWLGASWLEGRVAKRGEPTAYLCRGRECSIPALRPDELELPGPGTGG
jgi:uncharacterized protein YyaL (SSP411 family)